MDTPAGGLHRATLASGTTISGLLTATQLSVQLDLGPKLTVPMSAVQSFIFPVAGRKDNLAKLRLRNEDTLIGQVMPRDLTVLSKGEKLTVKSADITNADFTARPMGAVVLQVQGMGTINGRVQDETLSFKIDGGVEIPVFIGHIDKLEVPPPAGAPARPTSNPSSSPSVPAVPTAGASPGLPGGEEPVATQPVRIMRRPRVVPMPPQGDQ